MATHADFSNADAKLSFDHARSSELTRSKVSPFGKRRALLCTSRTPDYAALLNYSAAYPPFTFEITSRRRANTILSALFVYLPIFQ